MAILYVTSSQKGAGKTMLCAGLGRRIMNDRKKVGYMKLNMDGDSPEGDAAFMKEALCLPEPVENIIVTASREDLAGKAKQACDRLARGKDLVIVEGVPFTESDEVVKALNAKVLVVADYAIEPEVTADSYKTSGLLGVVLNKVPRKKVEKISAEASAKLKNSGVNLLGAIPEDRVLMAQTVVELAEQVKGKLLNANQKGGELVESVMFGAMTVDHGPYYFGRKNNKAALIKGERSDMQMAALQTSTRCIVLAKGVPPIPEVFNEAEKKGVSLISAEGDVQSLASTIEASFAEAKFNQVKKIPRLGEVLDKNLNLAEIYKGMGV